MAVAATVVVGGGSVEALDGITYPQPVEVQWGANSWLFEFSSDAMGVWFDCLVAEEVKARCCSSSRQNLQPVNPSGTHFRLPFPRLVESLWG